MTRELLIKKLKQINVILSNGNINPQARHKLTKCPELLNSLIRLTQFLSDDVSCKQRLHTVILGLTSLPLCKTCNIKPVLFYKNGKRNGTYSKYCSKQCAAKSQDRVSKIQQTKERRYGNSVFNNRDKARQSYAEKLKIPYSSFQLLENPKWLKEQHTTLKKPLTQIAQELMVSPTAVQQRFKQFNLTINQYNSSYTEDQVFNYVRSIYPREIIRNNQTLIRPYELDMYMPDINTAIEFNGIHWHLESQGKHRLYHLNKTTLCKKNNIRLLHISELDWIEKPDMIKSMIAHRLGATPDKIFARKCVVRPISSKESKEFLINTHIQGNINAPIRYGLFHDDELVSVMIFGRPRYNSHWEYELLRFSTKLNTVVVGGATKLFSHFVNHNNPNTVISYSNEDVNVGTVYLKMGFVFSHYSPPSYKYFKNGKLYSRVNFQKHKLKNKLPTFNPDLTEYENMLLNGYDRIWDCGNAVFVWKKDQ